MLHYQHPVLPVGVSADQSTASSLRIPVKVATQSTGMLPPKPVKAVTPSERSDAGGLLQFRIFATVLLYEPQRCFIFTINSLFSGRKRLAV
jgi:hypothetical protein